jgi:hypothetical protein
MSDGGMTPLRRLQYALVPVLGGCSMSPKEY